MKVLLVVLVLASFTVYAQDYPLESDRVPKITLKWGIDFSDGRVLPKVCWAENRCSTMSSKMHDIWVVWTAMSMRQSPINIGK